MSGRNEPGPNAEKARLGPPPRWLRCPRKGRLIAGKFLPLKTPLNYLYDDQVPEEYRFPPAMVFKNMESQKLKIGLWIDLTYTDRFYAKSEVEELGAVYKKVHCRGFGECPSAQQVDAFLTLCSEFIAQHPLDVIAVHCTHGFNRTGFLICAYLVEKMNWSIDAAVLEFIAARPPGMYKNEYIRELFSRFGDVDDAPPAPPLPEWCGEAEPVLDENEAESTARKAGGPQFDPPLKEVKLVRIAREKHRLQKICQDIVGYKGRGFPGSQPVSMDVLNVGYLTQKEYMVSWKADGIRYMMYIENEGKIFMYDRDHNVFQVSNLRFPHRKETPTERRHLVDTLVDGEMVVDEIESAAEKLVENSVKSEETGDKSSENAEPPSTSGGSTQQQVARPRFLIYDVVRYEGQPVGQCHLRKRFECVENELIRPRDRAAFEGRLDKASEPFSVRLKHFEPMVKGVPKFLNPEFQKSLPHEVDGLIFQPVPDPYVAGRCDQILKWKPPHLNSVDFKLKIVREHKEGMLPELKGYLYVLHMNEPFSEMKVNKQLRELDGKIIECKFEKVKTASGQQHGQWIFLRQRKDKSFPNAFNTAMNVCQSIQTPVTEQMLMHVVKTKAAKPNSYHPPAPHRVPPGGLPPPAPTASSHIPKSTSSTPTVNGTLSTSNTPNPAVAGNAETLAQSENGDRSTANSVSSGVSQKSSLTYPTGPTTLPAATDPTAVTVLTANGHSPADSSAKTDQSSPPAKKSRVDHDSQSKLDSVSDNVF